MQRDPSKRLGSQRDAEEIKQHRFFKGIDWNAVKNKELKPHKIKPPVIPVDGIPVEMMFGKIVNGENTKKVTGWSFISD